MNGPLTIAPGQRRRGREDYRVSHANYLLRIQGALTGLRRLLDLEERGVRTHEATHDLSEIERRVEQMLTEAQLAAILAALPAEQERTACDGS
jgi:hypothetical protein